MPLLRVAGVRASGPGYPVASETLRIIEEDDVAIVQDCGEALPGSAHLWRLGAPLSVKGIAVWWRLVLGNLRSAISVLLDIRRRSAPVYVPYPSVFFLFLCSFIPKVVRPACIADAYISIWDALCNDRLKHTRHSLVGALIRRIEGRAFRCARLVLVDTVANARLLSEVFEVHPDRVRAIPLAVDATKFLDLRDRCSAGSFVNVLFFGTMIPLHGVEKIVRAAELLADRGDIRFRLVGDGQIADDIAKSIKRSNISWERSWCTQEQLAEEVGKSHICLGVFGGLGKAARVLPFKVYYAMAAGRPVISQASYSLPEDTPPPPFVVPMGDDPESIAAVIAKLSDSIDERRRIGRASAAYFDRWLSRRRVASSWNDVMADTMTN